MTLKRLAKVKKTLLEEKDPLKRKFLMIGQLSKELREKNLPTPKLVGGAVVEFYTRGSYQTSDFDLVCEDKKAVRDLLIEMGFQKLASGSLYSDIFDIHFDLIDGPVQVGPYQPESFLAVQLVGCDEEPVFAYILTLEDIILDRLNAAAWWSGNSDPAESSDFLWAKALIASGGTELRTDRLRERTLADPELSRLLDRALREVEELSAPESGESLEKDHT